MLVPFNPRHYRRLSGGAGFVAICGLFIYEKYKINKILSNLLDTNVLDIDKKRPDYIYIKYHIYRESMRRLREKQQDKNLINIIIHPVGKWWKTFKHSVAWRLLNIAQKGDKHERLKAVRQLASIDHLKDWDFRHLAQICDARTAVSLARLNCDNRWFVPVHKSGIIKNPKLILSDIQKMLEKLRNNSCVNHFSKKYLDVGITKNSDDTDYYTIIAPISRQDNDLLKECIAFFNHCTTKISLCRKFLDEGILLQLMELKKLFKNDNETLATICKTLANLSMADNCVEDFFVSGWVGVLADWQKHPDVRLQVISSKVLANLDYDDQCHFIYPPNVYPLHPRARKCNIPALDIVFIHGLLGGVFYTWRQKDREPNELGLYGKNAFYTNESDDLFLVGEPKRDLLKNNGNREYKNNVNNIPIISTATPPTTTTTTVQTKVEESLTQAEAPIINKRRKVKDKASGISDTATKELVETLQMSAELGPEWEVVFPDCPLKSSSGAKGVFSVSGEKWVNDDYNEEYTNCWPMDWLPEDYPNIRVIGIDYTSAVTQWSANFAKYCPCEKGQGYVDVRATYLLERLHKAGIGFNRPIIWVGHSMGGLICKSIILKAVESPDPDVQRIAKNTKGIVFLGTPHRGSSIARWKQHMQMILSPSIEVKELEENSPKLLDLHNRFMRCLRTYLGHVKVVSVAEGEPTMLTTFKFPLRIVTEESAFLHFGDFYILRDDHLSLSKPVFRQSFLYQRLLALIENTMKNSDDSSGTERNDMQLKNVKNLFSFLPIFPTLLYKFLTPFET